MPSLYVYVWDLVRFPFSMLTLGVVLVQALLGSHGAEVSWVISRRHNVLQALGEGIVLWMYPLGLGILGPAVLCILTRCHFLCYPLTIANVSFHLSTISIFSKSLL